MEVLFLTQESDMDVMFPDGAPSLPAIVNAIFPTTDLIKFPSRIVFS